MKVKIETPEQVLEMTDVQLAEHAAKYNCHRFGWTLDGIEYRHLSNPYNISPDYLFDWAKVLYPKAIVTSE